MSRVLREPFRIFFALGWLASLFGVGMWPLYYWGILERYSGMVHSRFQIEGFLACFVAGFLLTAMPRILEVKPASKLELGSLLALVGFCLGAHALERPLVGDCFFLGVLVFFIVFAARRFGSRQDLPPPFFVLVPVGFLHAITGAVLLITAEAGPGTLEMLNAGKNFLNIGFVLCLILGIGSFLGPRFFGWVEGMPTTGSRNPSAAWRKKAALFLAAGLSVYASFWIEFLGWPRAGQLLRAAVASAVMLGMARLHRRIAAPGFLPQVMRLSMVMTLAGLWILPAFPGYRVAALHVLFVGGFGVMSFVVSMRVTLGHSGFEHLFQKRLALVGIVALLMTAAMVARAAADMDQEGYFAILALASVLWLAGAALWAGVLLPKLFFPRREED